MAESGTSYKERMGGPLNAQRKKPKIFASECTKEMTGKGRRLIISDAMTESGPVRGALWMFKADGKGKKRKIESKSKELSGEKKRCKLDSESTEKKEDKVDGGENESEIAEGISYEEDYHYSMDGESYKCYFEKSICQNIQKLSGNCD